LYEEAHELAKSAVAENKKLEALLEESKREQQDMRNTLRLTQRENQQLLRASFEAPVKASAPSGVYTFLEDLRALKLVQVNHLCQKYEDLLEEASEAETFPLDPSTLADLKNRVPASESEELTPFSENYQFTIPESESAPL